MCLYGTNTILCVIIQLHFIYLFWGISVRYSDVLFMSSLLDNYIYSVAIYNFDEVVMSRGNWKIFIYAFL
jgi:hypothetical protein